MVYLFRKLTSSYTRSNFPARLAFTLADVRAAMNDAVADGLVNNPIKNIADIKYTYDARRKLPDELVQLGPLTWIATGKGCYELIRTRRTNLIDLMAFLQNPPAIQEVLDQTPRSILPLLGNDEQAAFTRVRNAGLINSLLGFHAWHIQGHHRTTVTYGQIEIDEVHAGVGPGNTLTVVPISGKGGQDNLSWSQALNLNTYGAEKFKHIKLAVRSVGLWRDDSGDIWLVEFSPHLNIDDIEIVGVKRFRIIQG